MTLAWLHGDGPAVVAAAVTLTAGFTAGQVLAARRGKTRQDAGAAPSPAVVLRRVIIALYIALTPVFFAVMYSTVTRVVRQSFGWEAPAVPLASEGAFAIMFLLGVYLHLVRKPMGWLRWTPYPFVAASLALNVWAYLDSLPGIIGHTVVTAAFFLPVIAAEAAVRSVSADDGEGRRRAELRNACRYARDLLRDARGRWWRWKVPSLLRAQVTSGQLPAAVMAALDGGPPEWEPAVRKFVISGLIAGAWMRTEEDRERRRITAPAQEAPAPPRSGKAARVTSSDAKRSRVDELLQVTPQKTVREIAEIAGVSPSTVERAKRKLAQTG
ncbi:MAG TPA: winged helix-turn-helix domain-containing protein [Streptosporangiaceae bacterium]|nr:winged helix-turn-helix domain-containing protein [Streptosporangiaceae bacterium]